VKFRPGDGLQQAEHRRDDSALLDEFNLALKNRGGIAVKSDDKPALHLLTKDGCRRNRGAPLHPGIEGSGFIGFESRCGRPLLSKILCHSRRLGHSSALTYVGLNFEGGFFPRFHGLALTHGATVGKSKIQN